MKKGTSVTLSVSRRTLTFGMLTSAAIFAALALTSCSPEASGDLGRLQSIKEACPDQPVNVYDLVDGTATSQSDTIAAEHLHLIRTDIERAAVCGGHASVVVFGTNSVTTPVYDGDLAAQGATDIAKLRAVPKLVDEAMATITTNYPVAVQQLPQGGTDVTGLFPLLGEARALRPDMRLLASIYTDGVTNQGIAIDHTLTDAEATALANAVPVPNLSGAAVSMAGIGRVTGDPLPSDFIAGLKTFYTRVLERTGADPILVVTDGR